MKNVFVQACLLTLALSTSCQNPKKNTAVPPTPGIAAFWLTDPAKAVFFQQQTSISSSTAATGSQVITIDPSKTYQEIDGYGFSLTGGSAQHIIRMDAASRTGLLNELFRFDGKNIGTSYIRVSIGASDLNESVFSYNDLPAGETDTAMAKFDLAQDKLDVIPVLKEIININPLMKIMGSPWSPPVWMKTNGDTRGGSLKPEYYPAYAKYFVRYIEEMKKEGITIDAITVQNEPLHPGNNPSLLMLAPDQAIFVKNHLGPAFEKAGIKTKIIIYDHNADRPDYPISILNDPAAKKYIDGSAFHLYGGKIEALTEVHNAHPDKHIYFTEQWVGAPGNFSQDISNHVRDLIIGASRNWSRTVLEWNLAADPNSKPHTDRGGCDRCLGAVTIDKNTFVRNPAYYTIAHASKFVRPGSIRLESNLLDGLPNVAFLNPQGQTVLIALNTSSISKTFSIVLSGKTVQAQLPAGATGTFVF
ncbi:MAG: glucosylceramidase [Chitinophagaceae bacterium]|nr:glucosylceramidase [Chitinophagaceae bacterium]